MSVKKATVQRTSPADGYAGSVSVIVRLCASVGPKAQIVTRETRTVGGRTVARRRTVEPLGVDLTGPLPYDCANRYQLAWAVPTRLINAPGTYQATLRLTDALGRVSAPVSLRLASP